MDDKRPEWDARGTRVLVFAWDCSVHAGRAIPRTPFFAAARLSTARFVAKALEAGG